MLRGCRQSSGIFWVVPLPRIPVTTRIIIFMMFVFFSEPEIASKTRYIMQHQAPKILGRGSTKTTYEKSIKKKYCHVQNRLEPGRVRQTHGIFTYIWLILNDKSYSRQKDTVRPMGTHLLAIPKNSKYHTKLPSLRQNLLDL